MLKGHTNYVWSVAFSAEGLLASGSADTTVLWNTIGVSTWAIGGHVDATLGLRTGRPWVVLMDLLFSR